MSAAQRPSIAPTMGQIIDLTNQIEREEQWYRSNFHQCPIVQWIKDYSDGSGRMIMISDAHVDAFGIPADTYEGRTDYDVFSKEDAEQLRREDLQVISEKRPITFPPMKSFHPREGRWAASQCRKWPIYSNTGKIIGVGGMAWPVNE